jgi:hypothetical protein
VLSRCFDETFIRRDENQMDALRFKAGAKLKSRSQYEGISCIHIVSFNKQKRTLDEPWLNGHLEELILVNNLLPKEGQGLLEEVVLEATIIPLTDKDRHYFTNPNFQAAAVQLIRGKCVQQVIHEARPAFA